jgi:hypothetical protein
VEFDPRLPGVLDDAVCDVLAQIAEDLAHGLVVNGSCRQGLGRDGGPGLRVARCAARNTWSKVRAEASRWVNSAPRQAGYRAAPVMSAATMPVR